MYVDRSLLLFEFDSFIILAYLVVLSFILSGKDGLVSFAWNPVTDNTLMIATGSGDLQLITADNKTPLVQILFILVECLKVVCSSAVDLGWW